MLKVWDWRGGKWLCDVAIEHAVSPYVAVHRPRRKRGYETDGERKLPSRRWLARQRRREAKASASATAPAEGDADSTPEAEGDNDDGGEGFGEVEVGIEEDDGNESGDEATEGDLVPVTASQEPEERPLVLVVQKIDTLNIGGRLAVVFSAVGCVPCIAIACQLSDHTPVQCDCIVLVCITSRLGCNVGRTNRYACA